MLSKKSFTQNGLSKTLLIIIGVIIAILLTLNSELFTAESINLPGAELEPVAELPKDQNSKSQGSSGSSFNSPVQMFNIFTHNLPYLNNK
ncbi:MAG: hypothetical protein RJQ14_26360 [Marinoscillum sp.]